jgi:hypothetical protein
MDLSLNCWFRCTDCSLDQRSRYCLSARTDREPEKSERIGSLRSQISIPANASDTSLDLRARFGTAWTRSGEQQAIDILSSHRSSQKSALRGRSFRALRHRRPHTSRVSPTGRALRGQTTTERAQAPHMTNPLARVSVQQDSDAHRGQQVRDPVTPPTQESQVFEQLKQEHPSHRIESAFAISIFNRMLERPAHVEELSRRLDRPEICHAGTDLL